MQKFIKNITGIFSWMPVNQLIKISGQRLIFPFYHTVSETPPPHLKHVYPVKTPAVFKKDICRLLKHFQPVSVEDVLKHVREAQPIKKNAFLLTFDDGLKEIYHHVAPFLKQKGIPAVFFINTDFMDNKDLFFRYKASLVAEAYLKNPDKAAGKAILQKLAPYGMAKSSVKLSVLGVDYAHKAVLDELAPLVQTDFTGFLAAEQPYLTTPQISELVQDGFHIGSHSPDHPLFSRLHPEEQLAAITESLDVLQQNFNLPYRLFSFPFTDFGVRKALFEQLFHPQQPVLDASFGTAGIKNDITPFHFQRIPVETGIPLWFILKTEYLYYLLKGVFGRNTVVRK